MGKLRTIDAMESQDYEFLKGGGHLGALIRRHDWASTPIGEPESWPQALRTCLRLLLGTGHPMFIWWGPELIQFYNDAFSRSIGPERHPSALGQRGRECWDEIWDIIGPQIDHVLAGKGHTWHENHLVPITRHGRREDVYWTYSYGPIDDPDAPNQVGGILVLCTETTEQVLAKQRLAAAERRWRSLFDQSPGFMCFLTGPEHRIEFANPGFFSLIGDRHVVGRKMRDAIPEDQELIELLDRVYESGKAHTGVATPLLLDRVASRAGQQLYIDFVYQPITNDDNEVTGIVLEGSDVTERVVATEKLKQADRRKDEFLAMLGHELRNPLSPILSTSELLQKSDCHPDAQKFGAMLLRQVNQLKRLVDDLLDVSRITQDRIALQRDQLDLADAVELAIESVQPGLRAKKHVLTKSFPEAPVHVFADPARIVQAVGNILGNACKFTSEGGSLEVTLEAIDQSAVLTVRDNGSGMDEETIENVFEPFYQEDRSLGRAAGGLGIGLTLANRLIEMHDGSVGANSDGHGCGSTFVIRLPLSDTTIDEVDSAPDHRLEPRRILVVDDNRDAADALANLLTMDGHTCATVYSARDALEQIGSFGPDVALLDIGLPETDGYQLARKIRKDNTDIRLVAVTGYGQDSDVEIARNAGFDEHVTKPVEIAEIRRLVDSS